MKRIVHIAAFVLVALVASRAGMANDKPLEEIISSSETKRLTSALEKYLAEPEESTKRLEARDKFEKEVAKVKSKHKLDTLLKDIDYLGQLVTMAATHGHVRPVKNRVKEFTVEEEIAGRKTTATYHLWVPKAYKEDNPWPVLVGLHDNGQTGEEYLENVLADAALRDSYIIVCPTIEGDIRWHDQMGMFQLLGLVMHEVTNSYFVDKDRMYIDGTGAGGESACILASRFRDLFGGVVMRSAPFGSARVEGNLNHVPVMCAVGADDASLKIDEMRAKVDKLKAAKYPITLKEMAGSGKSSFAELNGEIATWLAEQKRVRFPETLSASIESRTFGRTYWMSIIRTETATTDEPVIANLVASTDREKNTIDITSENIYKIEIYLNDSIIDMDRPFSVRVNGKELWQGIKERSWRYMLDRYTSSGDPTRLFTASIEIDIPVQG